MQKHKVICSIVIVAIIIILLEFFIARHAENTTKFSLEAPPSLPKISIEDSYNLAANSLIAKSDDHDTDLVSIDAWVIKVASYKNKKSAEEKLANYQKEGLNSFMIASTVNGELYYRLYIGPYSKKENAIRQQKTINQKFSVNSELQEYNVEDF